MIWTGLLRKSSQQVLTKTSQHAPQNVTQNEQNVQGRCLDKEEFGFVYFGVLT